MIANLEGVFSALGAWSLVIIFLLVALESSAFLGLVVPGESAVILAGALAAARILNLWLSYGVVIAAAIVGDIFGYLLGRYYGDALLVRWTFARRHYLAHQAVLEDHFRRWGAMTVIAGRFVAVGRAFAPFTAGLSKMRALTFVPMAVAGGILWGGILLSLGYLFGENWRTLEHWIASIGAGVLALLGLTLAMLWLWRWLIARETSVERAWYRLLASRPATRVRPALARLGEFARARMSPSGYFGVHLSLGLLAVAALAWAFGAIAHDIFAQDPLVLVDRRVAFLIDDFRAPALDSLMVVVGLLGDTSWLAWLTALTALGLAAAGRAVAGLAMLLALGGAWALASGLQATFAHLQPHVAAGMVVHGFAGFPDVALTGATAVYTMACVLGLVALRSWRWWTLQVVGLVYLLLLLGLGALYREAELSSVLAAYALGGCWAAICATGFETWRRWSAEAAGVRREGGGRTAT